MNLDIKRFLCLDLGFQVLSTTQCPSLGTPWAILFLKGLCIPYRKTFSLPHRGFWSPCSLHRAQCDMVEKQ